MVSLEFQGSFQESCADSECGLHLAAECHLFRDAQPFQPTDICDGLATLSLALYLKGDLSAMETANDELASLLGHAQASTTLDIYAHAFDKNKRKAQEKLGKAIGL